MEIKAPNTYPRSPGKVLVFLAGSIEMGAAENWQTRVAEGLPEEVIVLNPRRDNWDSSWEQTIDHPQFREQVEWELQAQEDADLILMYFDPETKSPIALLELGLFSRSPMIVCCPDGFYRKGNVDIMCTRYALPMADSIDDLIKKAKHRLKYYG